MVISPSMTYGLNVVALTKSNRTRLRQYEREILKDMLQAARNQPKLKTQEILEEKTNTKTSSSHALTQLGESYSILGPPTTRGVTRAHCEPSGSKPMPTQLPFQNRTDGRICRALDSSCSCA
ncbi:hypothetical protein EVAR_70087_1 [Eumeta japonica]|uniref:Uncharacterized protein n=1 Tax=Eumeta variegata TaxID=151549 RepID=A0A4C1SGN9_EUMVA|nr:hypothetical protein EVAR_70087_1 [Eumeta japonica]